MTNRLRRNAARFGPLLVALLLVSCSGIEPYQPVDHREEGPDRGLFSGPKGEFVIFQRGNEPGTDGEAGNTLDEPAESEQQKTDNEEDGAEIKGSEQQPPKAAD